MSGRTNVTRRVASIIGLCPSMKNPRLRRGIFIALFFKSNTYSIKTPSSYGTLLLGGADHGENDFNYRG